MKKKVFSKKLTINKETVSNLTADSMKNMLGGYIDYSLIISCPYYMTICIILTACTGTKIPPTPPPA